MGSKIKPEADGQAAGDSCVSTRKHPEGRTLLLVMPGHLSSSQKEQIYQDSKANSPIKGTKGEDKGGH